MTKRPHFSWAHGSGAFRTNWTPELVVAAPDPVSAFSEYVQQLLGIPWPTRTDIVTLRRKAEEFFSHYPRLNWYTLCRVAQWCRAKGRRFARVWEVIDAFRGAYVAGALPEMRSDHNEDLDTAIATAIAQETDPEWRRRLLVAQGQNARRAVLNDWRTARA